MVSPSSLPLGARPRNLGLRPNGHESLRRADHCPPTALLTTSPDLTSGVVLLRAGPMVMDGFGIRMLTMLNDLESVRAQLDVGLEEDGRQ